MKIHPLVEVAQWLGHQIADRNPSLNSAWIILIKCRNLENLTASLRMMIVSGFFYFEGFTSIPTALTANVRNRRIQVYQASDG